MSIRNYTGIPGTGKTYRIVYDLMFGTWAKTYFIVHNIDGLKDEVISPEGYCKSWDYFRERLELAEDFDVWSRSFQDQFAADIREKYGRSLLYVIDEAQMIFGRRSVTDERFDWLTYHRHLGQQIWMASQTIDLLTKDVKDLVELEIRSRRGVITTKFVYQHFIRNKAFKIELTPTVQAVFDAYKSAEVHNKPMSRSYLLLIPFLIFALAGWGIYKFPDRFRNRSRPEAAKAESPQAAPPPPVTVAGSPPSVPPVVSAPVPRRRRVEPSQRFEAVAPVVARLPWDGWEFAGYIGGVPYLAKEGGAVLVKWADVVRDRTWAVLGGDPVRRVLRVLHVGGDLAEVAAGPVVWFGCDG